jgi:hypothetical protein
MRNLHVVAPQMAAQAPAGSERCPPEQAPAQGEFRDLSETVCKGTLPREAAGMELELFRPEILGKKSKLALGAPCLEVIGH